MLIVKFSAWMNAYVTHWTTNWLMGNSTIYDLGALMPRHVITSTVLSLLPSTLIVIVID